MRAIALTIGLFPAVALADCPTADDVERGVRFTASNGNTDTYRRTGDGVIEADFRDAGGQGTRVTLAKGIYILSFSRASGSEIDARSTSRWSYPEADFPDPVAEGGWDVEAIVASPDGTETQSQKIRFGEPTEMTFGDCTYEMLPIEAEFRAETFNYFDRLHYFPSLGIAYVAASGDLGGEPHFVTDNIRIEALD